MSRKKRGLKQVEAASLFGVLLSTGARRIILESRNRQCREC